MTKDELDDHVPEVFYDPEDSLFGTEKEDDDDENQTYVDRLMKGFK